MDKLVSDRTTVEGCRKLEANAIRLDRPEIASQCRLRAIEIQADTYIEGQDGTADISEAELDAVKGLMAYERVLSDKRGRKTRATKTRKMFDAHGALESVERSVVQDKLPDDYTSLVEEGFADHAFEAVILRHRDHFSPEAIKTSERIVKQHAA